MPFAEKDITKDNPFRPDGELRREVDELLQKSIITRNKCFIPNYTISENSRIFSETMSTNSIKPSLNNSKKNIPHNKSLSVHFSPTEKLNPDIDNPSFTQAIEYGDNDLYKSNENNTQEIIIETTSMVKPLHAERIKIPDKKLCCNIL